jgi:organic radical activating enzyme
VTFQSLILFLNRRCTTGCATCNADAQPGNREELSPGWLTAFFNKVARAPLPFSGYITWTGGEPFLSFRSLRTGIKLASAAGFHSEILTGGGWFSARPLYLEQLMDVGKPVLRISLDAEHQGRVPLPQVVSLIRAALALDLEVNFTLRDIPGRSPSPLRSIEEIKQQLPRFFRDNHQRSRWIHYIPHMPVKGGLVGSHQPARQPCRLAFRDLVIGEDGLAYPCCGFFGLPLHRKLALGDPLKETWDTLVSVKASFSYNSPCHLCAAEVRL